MADHSDHMSQTEAGRLDLVHRIGAAVVALVIIAFGVLGLVGGLGFFETSGEPVAGLNSNGLLSVISLLTGAVLIGSAVRGGRTASTVTATIGGLFILSGLLNLALLQTSFNILAFAIPNVFFSLVTGVVLLGVGLYGRVSGGLSQENPYRQEREAKAAERNGRDASAGDDGDADGDGDGKTDPERLEHLHEMEKIEIAVAEGRATPEQEKMIDDDLRRRSAQERERAWAHARKTGQYPS